MRHEQARRMGVPPNMLGLCHDSAPSIDIAMWTVTQFCYLDNPLPSVFKERLFAYLSRYCSVRYCLARHMGFLLGYGHIAGDPTCSPFQLEQVLQLVHRDFPEGQCLDPHLTKLSALHVPLDLSSLHDDSELDHAVFACCAHLFLQTSQAPMCHRALAHALDKSSYSYLRLFLAYVRMAHYWATVHPELEYDSDVLPLLTSCGEFSEVFSVSGSQGGQTYPLLDRLMQLQGLQTSRQYMETAIHHVGEGLTTIDRQNCLVGFNTRVKTLTGYSDQELLGKPLCMLVASPYHDELLAFLKPNQSATTEASGLTREVLGRRKDGTVFPLEISATSYTAGAEPLMILVLRDITTRKSKEEQLRASEERFRLATEVIRGIVYELDPLTHRIEWSAGLQEVLGWADHESLPTMEWWLMRVHPDDRHVCAARNTKTGTFPPSIEYRVRHRLGHWIHVEDRATIRSATRGSSPRVIGCILDITDRIRAHTLLNEQDCYQETFLEPLAYELRNSLMPIKSGFDLLDHHRVDDPTTNKTRAMIFRQVQHFSSLAEDLLDLSRIRSGNMQLQFEQLVLQDVFERAKEMTVSLIQSRGHDLIIHVPPRPVFFKGDRLRLSLVFSNLLLNAAKYMKPGGQIEVTARTQYPHVVVDIANNGIEMPPEKLPDIDDMFTQLPERPPYAAEGMGIGLQLAKTIIKLHQGRIEAHHNEAGLSITVSLPMLLETTVQIGSVTPVPDTTSTLQSTHVRILVTDDNVDIASTTSMLLELEGYQVKTAVTSAEALSIAEAFAPHVILLDIRMPGMDGYEVCRCIRSHDWGESIRLIAQSGWSPSIERERALRAGFDAYLAKPYSVDELQKAIRDVLENVPHDPLKRR